MIHYRIFAGDRAWDFVKKCFVPDNIGYGECWSWPKDRSSLHESEFDATDLNVLLKWRWSNERMEVFAHKAFLLSKAAAAREGLPTPELHEFYS